MLLNDLADIDNEVFLFLDDYHLVTDPAIRRAVSFLLRHAPSHLHLVLTTGPSMTVSESCRRVMLLSWSISRNDA